MSNITTHDGGGAVGAAGHLDVRSMMRHYLAPFKAAEPFREMIDTINRASFATQRNTHGELIALSSVWNTPQQKAWAIRDALAILEAVAGRLFRVAEASDALDEAMAPPPEVNVRAILGAMMSIMRGREFSVDDATYVDAMVMELMEPETGEPFSGPAIAAAAKELWSTQTFRPSIPEFMAPVRKHQARIELERAQLGFILEAEDCAYWVLRKLAPDMLPKARKLTDDEEARFWDDVFCDDNPLEDQP